MLDQFEGVEYGPTRTGTCTPTDEVATDEPESRDSHMKGRRTIVVIALAAIGLLEFQASVSHTCAYALAHASTSPTSAGHDHHDGHEPSNGHASDGPASTDAPSCPMSGLTLRCGTAAAAPVTLGTVVPASAVSAAGRLTPTFPIPPSFSGSELFHPPRA